MKNLMTVALSVLVFAWTTLSVAGTYYVDSVSPGLTIACTKSDPCSGIQTAIDMATPGSRIIVLPGYYSGQLSISGIDRLKVTSVAGARATQISTGSGNILSIADSEKVVFGQKKKGFSFEGSTTSSKVTVTNSPGFKFEGNVISSSAVTPGGDAMAIVGSPKSVVRYNTVSGSQWGIWFYDFNNEPAKTIVADNHVTADNGTCLYFTGVAPKSGLKVIDNTVASCGGSYGLIIATFAGGNYGTKVDGNKFLGGVSDGMNIYNEFGLKSKDSVVNNVIQNATGTAILVSGGNPLIKRNFVRQAGGGGIDVSNTEGARIQDNLVQDAYPPLEHYSHSVDTTVTGNQFAGLVYVNAGGAAFKKFSRNNLDFCGFEFDMSEPGDPTITASKNFLGARNNDGLPDFGHCSGDTYDAYVNDRLLVDPVDKPNPVKYKSDI